ncbi:hypothetical protein K7432_016395 [Basidiobolus ranarum]|uniref:Uncharacterized protein n=1 Tax=Basidiobolus ranarum TaxID=34480 RepID=A0ABR2WES5_9FUNG
MNPDLLIKLFYEDFREKLQNHSEILIHNLLKSLAESQNAFINAYHANLPGTFQCTAKLTTGKDKGQRCKYRAKERKLCGHHLRHLHKTFSGEKETPRESFNDTQVSKPKVSSGETLFGEDTNLNKDTCKVLSKKNTVALTEVIPNENLSEKELLKEPFLCKQPPDKRASGMDLLKEPLLRKQLPDQQTLDENTLLCKQPGGNYYSGKELLKEPLLGKQHREYQSFGEPVSENTFPEESAHEDKPTSQVEKFYARSFSDTKLSKETIYVATRNMLPVDHLDIISNEIYTLVAKSEGVVPLVKDYLIPYTYSSLVNKVKRSIGI